MSEAMEVRGLSVGINGTELIHGVDLTVPADSTVAVVGESGSGKSLTAKALCGLLPARSQVRGSYRLFGRTVRLAGSEREWRRLRGGTIVWLPQDPFSSLDPLRTCGAQIAAGSRHPKGERRSQAERLLGDVGLDAAVYDAYPHELSGGMCQRVAIAAALASEPKVLVADEPTTALDAQTQEGVLDLLDALRARRHLTLILITHDLALAAERSEHIVVFHQGDIAEEGSRDNVVFHPRSRYTRELLDAHARLQATERQGTGTVVLDVDHICKTYDGGGTRAVDDVSLRVHTGEIVGLVGESGSGKSTLARCIVALEHADSGSIAYRDGSGNAVGWSRGQAQLIFQNPYGSLNPTMTVRQTLAEALRVSGKAFDRGSVKSLLDRVGLEAELIDRKPGTLSGGQCQRVAIARALAPEPRLLVADEAITALDANIQTHVLETLLEIRERLGLAVLFISHDLDTVRRIADRIAVMRHGEIVEAGGTAEVMAHPRHAYTRALIAAMPKGLDTFAAPTSALQTGQ